MKGNVNAAASFALVAAVLAACGSAYAGPLPIGAIPPASGELTTLADLVVMLKRELQAVEQRLVAECDAVEARDHFVDVRNRALTAVNRRSEEHTSELQSRLHLVCRLLLEKKKRITNQHAKCIHAHGRCR